MDRETRLERLRAVLPDSGLSGAAREAVERAPDWLAEELHDNLRRMSTSAQDTFAGLIMSAQDPVVDEIAFQVARMAPASLTHELFTPQLIVVAGKPSEFRYSARPSRKAFAAA